MAQSDTAGRSALRPRAVPPRRCCQTSDRQLGPDLMVRGRFSWDQVHIYFTALARYTRLMTRRTTIEIDDVLLHAAQRALGTRGLKDTVDAAMREAVRREQLAELGRATVSGELYDRDPELLRAARG